MILEIEGRDFEINVTHLILQIDVLDFFIGSIACTNYIVTDRLWEWSQKAPKWNYVFIYSCWILQLHEAALGISSRELKVSCWQAPLLDTITKKKQKNFGARRSIVCF